MKRDIAFKRDCLIVKILNEHKGRENVISSKQICKELAEVGYPTNDFTLRTAIKRIRKERCMPVCHDNSKGYYMPACKSDIEASINDLVSRVNELNEHIDFLKGFIF